MTAATTRGYPLRRCAAAEIVTLLAAGLAPQAVAMRLDVDEAAVEGVAQRYGWPSRVAMRDSLARLEQSAQDRGLPGALGARRRVPDAITLDALVRIGATSNSPATRAAVRALLAAAGILHRCIATDTSVQLACLTPTDTRIRAWARSVGLLPAGRRGAATEVLRRAYAYAYGLPQPVFRARTRSAAVRMAHTDPDRSVATAGDPHHSKGACRA